MKLFDKFIRSSSEYKKLETEIRNVRAENLEWIDKLNETVNERDWLQAAAKSQENSIEILKKELIERDRELKSSREALESLNKLCTEEDKVLRETIESRDKEIKVLKSKHSVQRDNIRESLKALSDAEKALDELRKEIKTIKRRHSVQRKIIDDLKAELEQPKVKKTDETAMCPKCGMNMKLKDRVMCGAPYSYICKKCSGKILGKAKGGN